MGDKAIAIASNLNACVPSTPLQITQTSTTPGTPVAISATRLYFRQAIILGRKTLDGLGLDDNADPVVVGFDSAAGKQPIAISPGATYVLQPTPGEKWDFADLYLDVTTSGDGVAIIYS